MQGFNADAFLANVERLLKEIYINCTFYMYNMPLEPHFPFVVLSLKGNISSGVVGQHLDVIDLQLVVAYAERASTNLTGKRLVLLHEFCHGHMTLNDVAGKPTCNKINSISFDQFSAFILNIPGEGIQGWETTISIDIAYKF